MGNMTQSIPLGKLAAHPDNPNRMSDTNFRKLVRNIERSGLYEPLTVRPSPEGRGFFQIINGYHRWKALEQLGYEEANCAVWEIDDEQADIFLATLNRLRGSDEAGKRIMLLKRLNAIIEAGKLAKLLPMTAKQIGHLVNLTMPTCAAGEAKKTAGNFFANPMVFFLSDSQKKVVEEALCRVGKSQEERTRAGENAAALECIARFFLNNSKANQGGQE